MIAHDLDRIKRSQSVRQCLDANGIKYRREGRRYVFSCPSHADRSPSCTGEDRDGIALYRCHACQWGGTNVDLTMAVRGCTVGEAVRYLADRAAVEGEGGAARPARPARELEPPPPADLSLTLAACTLPLDHADAADVAAYLESRKLLGIAHERRWRALDTTEIRYQLDERLALDGEPTDLECAGFVRRCDDGWRLQFTDHRLVIPWVDRKGRTTALQRRQIAPCPPNERWATAGRVVDPYGADLLGGMDPDVGIAFVEGAIDALALWALDIDAGEKRYSLGLPGVAGWRRQWGELARGRVATVALDADDAGRRPRQTITDDLYEAGALLVKWATPVGGKDWGDVLHAKWTVGP